MTIVIIMKITKDRCFSDQSERLGPIIEMFPTVESADQDAMPEHPR
jgi:hypothetical protein